MCSYIPADAPWAPCALGALASSNSRVTFSIVFCELESDRVRNFRLQLQYRAASSSVSTPDLTASCTFARVICPPNVSPGMAAGVRLRVALAYGSYLTSC